MPRPAKVPAPPPPGFVWIKEASRLTGLSVKTLYNYRHKGLGPQPTVIGRKLAYSRAGINRYLGNLQNPTPDADRVRESRPAEPRISRRKPARAAA